MTVGRAWPPGPVMTSSRWDRPTRKRWTSPLWMPTDMRSGTVPTEVGIGRCLPQRGPHLDCRAGGLARRGLAPRNSSRRASPPNLSREPVRVVGQREHGGEDAVEDLGELLGADAAPAGQALGQVGEARDVDEAQRGVERLPPAPGRVQIPLRREAGDVAAQPARRLVWSASQRRPGPGGRDENLPGRASCARTRRDQLGTWAQAARGGSDVRRSAAACRRRAAWSARMARAMAMPARPTRRVRWESRSWRERRRRGGARAARWRGLPYGGPVRPPPPSDGGSSSWS